MNKHKLFKELFTLSNEELYDLESLVNTMREAREDFERVGVPFSYEAFIEYTKRVYIPQINASNGGHYAEAYKRQLQIILGDNLDIIEDAAEKKGLL